MKLLGLNGLKKIISIIKNKVDKVEGKDLSTEDFTTELKNKLINLSNNGDNENNIIITTDDFYDTKSFNSFILGNVDPVFGVKYSFYNKLKDCYLNNKNFYFEGNYITKGAAIIDDDIYEGYAYFICIPNMTIISCHIYLSEDTSYDFMVKNSSFALNLFNSLDNKKVNKQNGKDLSTNDYTNIDKNKVDRLYYNFPTHDLLVEEGYLKSNNYDLYSYIDALFCYIWANNKNKQLNLYGYGYLNTVVSIEYYQYPDSSYAEKENYPRYAFIKVTTLNLDSYVFNVYDGTVNYRKILQSDLGDMTNTFNNYTVFNSIIDAKAGISCLNGSSYLEELEVIKLKHSVYYNENRVFLCNGDTGFYLNPNTIYISDDIYSNEITLQDCLDYLNNFTVKNSIFNYENEYDYSDTHIRHLNFAPAIKSLNDKIDIICNHLGISI